jgi:putative transposase
MPNHPHIVLKTPQPNLARGMQVFLSGYTNSWSRRHRFSGHVFRGRYRTELVEDETCLWTVKLVRFARSRGHRTFTLRTLSNPRIE